MSKLPLRVRIAGRFWTLWPFAFAWYRVTQLLSLLFREDSAVDTSPQSFPGAVLEAGSGSRYRADRKVLDAMSHPRVIQARLDRGEDLGDCEDHAARYISRLGDYYPNPYLFSILMWDPNTETMVGHCVAAYRSLGRFMWADYSEPRTVFGAAAVGQDVADEFRCKLVAVSWCPVYLDRRRGLRFIYDRGGHYRP